MRADGRANGAAPRIRCQIGRARTHSRAGSAAERRAEHAPPPPASRAAVTGSSARRSQPPMASTASMTQSAIVASRGTIVGRFGSGEQPTAATSNTHATIAAPRLNLQHLEQEADEIHEQAEAGPRAA